MKDQMTREELVVLVAKMQDTQFSDAEWDGFVGILKDNVKDPEILEYLHLDLTAEEVVQRALSYIPEEQVKGDLNRDELLALIDDLKRDLFERGGDGHRQIQALRKNIPNPNWLALIDSPDDLPEQILERALKYKPLQL